MAVLKYRMAAKLIAIYDCIFTGLANIVLFGLLGLSISSETSIKRSFDLGVFVLLATGYYLVSFIFALNLLGSTKSEYPEEHVCTVIAWMLCKIAEFLIWASLGFVYCVWNSPTPFIAACGAVLGMLPVALFQSIYMYFVYQFKMELSGFVENF